MQLNEGQVATILYRNEAKQETTVRKIIPTSVPGDSIRAIDIGHLSEAEQAEQTKLYGEYSEYRRLHMSRMFSFEEFASQTTGKAVEPKWRAFKVAAIKLKP